MYLLSLKKILENENQNSRELAYSNDINMLRWQNKGIPPTGVFTSLYGTYNS